MNFTKEEIRSARSVDLAGFLTSRFPENYRKIGNSLVERDNKSLSIRFGYTGYLDFATGERGNSVDYLTNRLHYSLPDAVKMLNQYAGQASSLPACPHRPFSMPVPADQPFSRVRDYLLEVRLIPVSFTDELIRKGLLYQEEHTGNAVFANPEGDYCELRGTYRNETRPFHGCRKASPNRFWYYNDCDDVKPVRVYICEAAIDAISLKLLMSVRGPIYFPCVFVSIGGVANQQTIDRIKSRAPTILAVDNDDAGEQCRKRNPELDYIIPGGKDWNEDWIAEYSVILNEPPIR